MKINLAKLGGQMAVGLIVVGFLLIFLGWNGAASLDRVPSQIPYLLSGGAIGLALVVLGVGLMVVQSHRRDRAILQATLEAVHEALQATSRSASPASASASGRSARDADDSLVVTGTTSFHRPSCRLVEGRDDLGSATAAEALDAGLVPCRTCRPSGPVVELDEPADDFSETAPLRAVRPARRRA